MRAASVGLADVHLPAVVYTEVMRVTISEFRKNIFALTDRALEGEAIEFSHKGRTLRLKPDATESKLSRLKVRKVFVDPGDSLKRIKARMNREMQKEWEKDWNEL